MAAQNLVGPVLQAGEMAQAVEEAIRIDNPGAEVHAIDRGSYVRIHTEHRCLLSRSTLESVLGYPVQLNEIEEHLTAFAGRISTSTDQFVWEDRK